MFQNVGQFRKPDNFCLRGKKRNGPLCLFNEVVVHVQYQKRLAQRGELFPRWAVEHGVVRPPRMWLSQQVVDHEFMQQVCRPVLGSFRSSAEATLLPPVPIPSEMRTVGTWFRFVQVTVFEGRDFLGRENRGGDQRYPAHPFRESGSYVDGFAGAGVNTHHVKLPDSDRI